MILSGVTQEELIRIIRKSEREAGRKEERDLIFKDMKAMIEKGVSLEDAVRILAERWEMEA